MDISSDHNDAPRKAVDVVQLDRHFRNKNGQWQKAEPYLLITDSACPAQQVRLSGEGHGDRYLRHYDVAHAQGTGERIGAAQARVEHEDGVGDEDEQPAEGEASRDGKVERVHEGGVHDRCPARHARRCAAR